MALRRLVYGSVAVNSFDEAALEGILRKARVRNEERGVTGLLLYADHSFLQILEGPADTLTDLVSLIQKDPRHKGFVILLDEEVATRDFAGWSMGFQRNVNLEREIPGFHALLETHGDESKKALAAVSLKVRGLIQGFRMTTRV